MKPFVSVSTSSPVNLRRVLVLKNIAVVGLTLAVLVVAKGMGMPLPFAVIGTVLLVLNILTWIRFKLPWPVQEIEVFGQLVLDVLLLSALLYLAGGTTNPFVLLLLLPLTIAAATLLAIYAWLLAALIVACYTFLMFVYIPLPHFHIDHVARLDSSAWLMWFGFVLGVGLVGYYVVKMGNTLRERERMLAEVRENALRDEHLVALGTLAVGAAHELGTPLGTMAVVLKELEHQYATQPELVQELHLLRDQVTRCKNTLSQMLSSTEQARAESGYSVALDSYFEDLLVQWRGMRPSAQVSYHWNGPSPAPQIVAEQVLGQVITNILNNAADASEHSVEVEVSCTTEQLKIEVSDRGAGLTPTAETHAGELFFTTKESGQGLGLFLVNAALRRFGGTLSLSNRDGGGVCTCVILPLASLRVTNSI
ncbi:MAG: two-component system, sensor histidine kinase RegB [Candidatus Nitrotoga sp. CP45]|nr:MAG: two-component system, sensor histidine kinase RegB [Candidatus Nitrotoga sp. CP45]